MPHIQTAIRKQCEQVLVNSAPLAISVLMELAKSASSESVRFQAAASLLDRTGYKQAEKLEISDHRTIEDVDREIGNLAGVGAERAIFRYTQGHRCQEAIPLSS
jgi:hypothetical protein